MSAIERNNFCRPMRFVGGSYSTYNAAVNTGEAALYQKPCISEWLSLDFPTSFDILVLIFHGVGLSARRPLRK
jgi:hypothetical protein